MGAPHIWLRAESKPLEERSALTPTTAKKLADAGFKITIERSSQRAFKDSEYEKLGFTMAPEGSWRNAPKDAYILGLKELPENDDSPLHHTHIQFAHCYKNQEGWRDVLSRFPAGNGTLYDLEFLQDDNGRRVAAFGYHAGFAGSALSCLVWAHQILRPGKPFPAVRPFPNERALVRHVARQVRQAAKKQGDFPQILIIGALGRCGTGAADLATKAGIPENKILRWDINETKKGGPFKEITESDIFVNCIYLSVPIPKFCTLESLNVPGRKLRVVCDVSCDTTNPNNPVPIYNVNTTFDHPTVPVKGITGNLPLDVISIDHLPTLLPRESSEAFSEALLPSLFQLQNVNRAPVWVRAKKLFDTMVAKL
ncbi:saccharopine dehydrogenase Lys3 [Schizosaccharomyces japonicus yFS275]|uniref:Saccharopine dehydrogenase [NAD(+), L-lysine-forming] n=1 Tax=Schizosaccharomyces japonicus (strain yFS275 / FY16936) TaxID=402676 RepID=B6K2C0_SCHJY|nr:saccharopine dehydrogenase Lys3 [Schizosaccharomyces japonicus yFS275]EEB07301.1 saccharopine dehydrogenase Lys3 [Schizosaccharomyces japonicus yFS275]